MRDHTTRRALVTLLLTGCVLVAACGSDSSSSSPTTVSTPLPSIGPTPSDGPKPTTSTSTSPPTTDKAGNYPQVFETAHSGVLRTIKLRVEKIVSFDAPIVVVPRPGSDLLYVAEREGRVKSFTVNSDGKAQKADGTVLDITDDTTTEAERGLLGLAFSKDGSTLYVSHTNKDGNTRLESYAMTGDVADKASKEVLFAVDQPYPNHNGGNVVLGPDGMLWMGMGDGGSGEDPANRAQDPGTPLGKMLRIDPTKPNQPMIWALGLRNPWRFSFDRKTDDLWIGDVGQDTTEEVDFLPAGTKAGSNFGWSGFEGTELFINKQARVPAVSVPPIFEMAHNEGWCSVTGGVVYRGTRIPALDGTYLFGDYCKAGLHGLQLQDGVVSDQQDMGVAIDKIVSINEDGNGEVYLISLDGGIYALNAG